MQQPLWTAILNLSLHAPLADLSIIPEVLMKCWHCGSENPAQNKFCGECGRPQISKATNGPAASSLPKVPPASEISQSPAHLAAPAQPPVTAATNPAGDQHNPLVEEPRIARDRVQDIAVPPVPPASTYVPQVLSQSETVRTERNEQREHRDSHRDMNRDAHRIGGPSILGLSYEPESDSEDTSSHYLLEDDPPQRSYAPGLLAIVLLLAAGYFMYRNWEPIRAQTHNWMEMAQENQKETAKPSAATTANRPAPAAASDNNTISDEPHPADSTSQVASAKPAENNDATKPEGDHAQEPAESASSDEPEPEDKTEDKADPGADKTPLDRSDADSAAKPEEKSAKARTAPREANAVDNSKVLLAQKYLQGKGVAQDCNHGFILLREAAQEANARARIQMGALYATGRCVEQDRAQAYRWFNQAQDLEPQNQWLQQTLNKLWEQMTAAERKRAETGNL
jgi:hypothetical protein